MTTELNPKNTTQGQPSSSPTLQVKDPPDFSEGGSTHRKAILASTVVIFVLTFATKIQPQILGIDVPATIMWGAIIVAHIYFFMMWRITAPIENDVDKAFFNWKGICKQATLGGTKGFPSKTKMQIVLIRALPIWAFLFGLALGTKQLWEIL